MKYAVMIIVLVVVFAVMGLIAAWGAMSYLNPAEVDPDQYGNRDETILLMFGFFPLGGAAVGLAVGSVAAIVGLVSEHQRAKREASSGSDRSPLAV